MTTESLKTSAGYETTKPAHRKRRVASLTAQTLWNIQMEDDVTGKIAEDFYFSDDEIFEEIGKTIPLRQSAKKNKKDSSSSSGERKDDNNNKIRKKRGRKRKSETDKSPKNMPANKKEDVFVSSNTSTTFRRKGKLTAAVAPLVKSPSPFSLHGSSNSSSAIYPSHKHLYNQMTFGNRFVAKDPTAMLTCVKCQKQLLGFNPPMFGQNLNYNFTNRTCTHQQHATQFGTSGIHDNDNSGLQDQPLNLKLGETSIPSKLSFHKTESGKQSVTVRSFNGVQGVSKNETVKISSLNSAKDKGNSSTYDASSPASTTGSSCSTESDELRPGTPNITKRRRKSTTPKVNLRVIAAPPPGSEDKRQPKPSAIRKFYAKGRKKSLKKPTGRLTVLPVKDNVSYETNNNGWNWDGKPYYADVFSMKELKPVKRRCYPAMRRKAEEPGMPDDVVMVRDCVLLLADDNDQQSYVAKVASLWQHPGTGGMMMSVLWFYRPEHTEDTRVLDHVTDYSDDELFASRHLDEISVACVEDKCYVLTYAQYCRYTCLQSRKSLVNLDPRIKLFSKSLRDKNRVLPHQTVPETTDPNLVYYSRKFYDIKLRRVLKSLPPPAPLYEKS